MTFTLTAEKRNIGRRAAMDARAASKVPAIMYGHGFASEPVTLVRGEFDRVYRQAGESTLIDVLLAGAQPIKALIYDVDHDPVTSDVRHVDLYRVTMTEKIHAEIPLNFIGEAPAVKALGGVLVKNLAKIRVECLPADLLSSIDVDVSRLANFNDYIYVRDLSLSAAITVLEQPGEIVTTVTPPREEEVAPVSTSEADAVAGVKVAGEEKKKAEEDEEAAEGGKKSGEAGSGPAGKEKKK